jgi:hypothetical protein
MTCVTLNPDKFNCMYLGERVKALPEIGVFQRILSSSPACRSPGFNPTEKEGVNKIL